MILHISNDYSGSSVYKNLFRELDYLGIQQIVYNPIRDPKRNGKNKISFRMSKSEIIYSEILNKTIDRIFYRWKIRKIVKDVESKIDINKIKLIHAHTWYSDGGVAFMLHKKYNIPYIITVRNTDVNVFLKYFVFDRKFGVKILKSSSNILTISEVYKKRLLQNTYLKKNQEIFRNNLVVIPNGVDEFWIRNVNDRSQVRSIKFPVRLLYVGKFDKGKNVENLIRAVINLNKISDKFHLTLVGGGGIIHEKILKLCRGKLYLNFAGKVNQLEDLKKFYMDSDIFTMPSKRETFGLVYIEALSQGTPILYTKGEGIDGCYGSEIGEKVENCSSEEIQTKLLKMVNNFENYNFKAEDIVKNHKWEDIAKKILMIYQ